MITLDELIAALIKEREEGGTGYGSMEVVFATDYGDRCHTQQAHMLNGELAPHFIRESAYSDSGVAIEEDPDEQDGDPDVLVLS